MDERWSKGGYGLDEVGVDGMGWGSVMGLLMGSMLTVWPDGWKWDMTDFIFFTWPERRRVETG